MSGPGAIRRGITPAYVEPDVLSRRFGCDVVSTPPGVVVIAWDASARRWLATPPQEQVRTARLETLLPFLGELGGRLRDEPWWSLVCVDDGWPEGVELGGVAPRLSSRQPGVLAFGRHRGDTGVGLLPDTHYLYSWGYLKTRGRMVLEDRAWERKQPSAIFCGGRHGSPFSFERPTTGRGSSSRDELERLAGELALPLEVHLGGRVSRAEQLKHRMLIDVDGHARTWDAWAWKLRSRSVVLSQTSVWDSFFSVEFRAGEHFVPLANDLSDLAEQVTWCLRNDEEAHLIAQRGRRRAAEVYAKAAVRRRARAAVEGVVFGRPET
jgi:hypothetical protein